MSLMSLNNGRSFVAPLEVWDFINEAEIVFHISVQADRLILDRLVHPKYGLQDLDELQEYCMWHLEKYDTYFICDMYGVLFRATPDYLRDVALYKEKGLDMYEEFTPEELRLAADYLQPRYDKWNPMDGSFDISMKKLRTFLVKCNVLK